MFVFCILFNCKSTIRQHLVPLTFVLNGELFDPIFCSGKLHRRGREEHWMLLGSLFYSHICSVSPFYVYFFFMLYFNMSCHYIWTFSHMWIYFSSCLIHLMLFYFNRIYHWLNFYMSIMTVYDSNMFLTQLHRNTFSHFFSS